MHPPLFRPHPLCQSVVEAFVKCHDDNPRMKYLGACNDLKAELDICFRKEKEIKRKHNIDKARERRAKYEDIKSKLECGEMELPEGFGQPKNRTS